MEIQINKIIKKHGQRAILDIEQLHLLPKGFYGILGPNGSGKSTLLRLIAGLEKPNAGSVFYDGRGLNDRCWKEMTYMSQQHYLLRATVFDNIAYPLKIRRAAPQVIEEKVAAMMKELMLDGLSGQQATKLSGGESQKVALARALIFEPRLLLLDEPTASIDPDAMALIEKVLKKRHERQIGTTIMVTHNVAQAKDLCDQIMTMRNGRIFLCDSLETR